MNLDDIGIGHIAAGYAGYTGYNGDDPFPNLSKYVGYTVLLAILYLVVITYLPFTFMFEIFLLADILIACYLTVGVFARGQVFSGICGALMTSVLIWICWGWWQWTLQLTF